MPWGDSSRSTRTRSTSATRPCRDRNGSRPPSRSSGGRRPVPDLITPGLDALRHVGRTYATTRFVRDGATLYVTDGAAFVALPDRWPDVEHDPWTSAAMARRLAPAIVAAIRKATAPAYLMPVAGNLDATMALGRSCACGGLRVACEVCGGDGTIDDDEPGIQCTECDGIGTVECMVGRCVAGVI